MLCIGGLDPTGRAGLLADAWAVREAGAEPLAVATALTAQGGRRFALNPVPVAALTSQLEAAVASGPLHAVKLGMIASAAQLKVIVRLCGRVRVPWVVDPVTSTSRGERLSRLAPRDYLGLARLRPWLTPNAAELAWLELGPDALLDRGFGAILVKGGDAAVDLLVQPGSVRHFRSRPVERDRVHHRGTGCRLASALAARLAHRDPPELAVRRARRVVLEFLNAPIMRKTF